MLLGVGLLVVIIFLAGMVLTTVQAMTEHVLPAPDFLWGLGQILMTLLLNTCLFTLLYRWLPKASIRWW